MRCVKRCCRCYRYDNKYFDEIDLSKLEKLKTENSDFILLDVRSPQEYAEDHLEGSICIPSYDIKKMIERILPNKMATIAVYCEYGGRSRRVVDQMKTMGYTNVYNLKMN